MIAVQGTLDELGDPLVATTFVVVDLETTGGLAGRAARSPRSARSRCAAARCSASSRPWSTPACRSRRSSPCSPASPTRWWPAAPRLQAVAAGLPRVRRRLRAGRAQRAVRHRLPQGRVRRGRASRGRGRACSTPPGWPAASLTRDEAPNCKLVDAGPAVPRHAPRPTTGRSHDARATVDVLHGLIERLGNLGVHTARRAVTLHRAGHPGPAAQAPPRRGACPTPPGVYLFVDAQRRRALRRQEQGPALPRPHLLHGVARPRTRMAEMVGLAERVTPHRLRDRARGRGARAAPDRRSTSRRYNRRSRFPERATWLKLTVEAFPRLSLVREVRDDGADVPRPVRRAPAGRARHGRRPRGVPHPPVHRAAVADAAAGRPCALAEMGRCGAPCDGGESVDAYAQHADAVRLAFTADPRDRRRPPAGPYRVARRRPALRGGRGPPRPHAAVRPRRRPAPADRRPHRRAELVAARRLEAGGWEIAVVRHGRLAAAAASRPVRTPRPTLDALVATAETVVPAPPPLPAATAEETECVLRWLDVPGTRLVEIDGVWALPAGGAGGLAGLVAAAGLGDRAARPFDDLRSLRPVR